MKNNLLLSTLFFISGFSSAQTNVYHPFPEFGAVWNVESTLYCQLWQTYEIDDYSYQIIGDTLINSNTYHKLFILAVDRVVPYCSQVVFPGYKGAIRQDTSIKKVFYVPPGDSTEQLLYDFNLALGDTAKGFLEKYCTGGSEDIVTSVDSILIGNNYRRRWEISSQSWWSTYMIEGIGYTNGLLEGSPCNIADGPGYSLLCFQENGQTLYPDTILNCNIIDVIKEAGYKYTQSSIILFPNPFHSNTTLMANSQFISKYSGRDAQLKIYNTMGVIVRKTSFSIGEDIVVTELERVDLLNGLYFYELRTNTNELLGIGKLVVE